MAETQQEAWDRAAAAKGRDTTNQAVLRFLRAQELALDPEEG
jgi:hypothetical protein